MTSKKKLWRVLNLLEHILIFEREGLQTTLEELFKILPLEDGM